MNENIIKEVSNELNITDLSVKAVLKLLSEGATIPFIARYRKEVTGGLDETIIKRIEEVYSYEQNLLSRKEDVIRLIDEKGLLSQDLKDKILMCNKLVEIEDLYRPYKEKKKTKATDAINNGLEPLAKMIMSFNVDDLQIASSKFLSNNVHTTEEAIEGASYIIAEWISDNAFFRKVIRSIFYKTGIIKSVKKKKSVDANSTYEMYYDFSEPIRYVKPHRILAINRGEKEKILNVNIVVDEEEIVNYLKEKNIKDSKSVCASIVEKALKDSYKRLIEPSVEREIRSELTETSEDTAIENFGINLEHLLLTPPMKEKIVLGFDPAFRTGCKLAVLNALGNVLDIKVIYPNEPKNDYEGSKKVLIELIEKYNVDIIAIGNGTASRESEMFVSSVIKSIDKKVSYAIVNEAGASVYSASNLAIKEFPLLHVEQRSAISIGRRLQDALCELVKITPESIGVGLYQHDVNSKKLHESLDYVVMKCVNNVGVNINTASQSILNYVSGLKKPDVNKILEYRNKYGFIKTRKEISKLLNKKSYEQSIGFLRIIGGQNPLDKTSIHPESYSATLMLLNELNMNLTDIGSKQLNDFLDNISVEEYSKKLNVDKYTLEDIILSLKKPNRDPREQMDAPILKSDVLQISDLHINQELQGTVRNVVDFGCFVDIGLHDDGLIHISKMSKSYIKHPSELLNVGDIVTVYVIDINLDKSKVSLSLINPNNC